MTHPSYPDLLIMKQEWRTFETEAVSAGKTATSAKAKARDAKRDYRKARKSFKEAKKAAKKAAKLERKAWARAEAMHKAIARETRNATRRANRVAAKLNRVEPVVLPARKRKPSEAQESALAFKKVAEQLNSTATATG